MNAIKNLIVFLCAGAVLIATISFGGNLLAMPGCWIDWGGSKMEWRTRLWTCQVNHPTMGWIPASKIRGSE